MRPVTAPCHIEGHRPRQRCLLHLQVRVQIDLRRFDRLVPKPQRDHGAVDAVLQEVHGGRVPKDVGRYPLLSERRGARGRDLYVLLDDALDGVAAEGPPADGCEYGIPIAGGVLSQPRGETGVGISPKRSTSLLATLPAAAKVSTGSSRHILSLQCDQFGDTKACLQVIESGRFDTAQVYYNAVNPSAAWRRVPAGWNGGQDFCGILAACFHQKMGVLNIRVWAGGVLASPRPPERLFVMISDTDLSNEVRCAAAVRNALAGNDTPAQAALRFVLDNRDFASRVIGIRTIEQLDAALDALGRGPLPAAAVSKLEALWANGFMGA